MSIQITEPVNSTPVTDLMKQWSKGLEVHVPQSLPGFSLDVVPYSDYFANLTEMLSHVPEERLTKMKARHYPRGKAFRKLMAMRERGTKRLRNVRPKGIEHGDAHNEVTLEFTCDLGGSKEKLIKSIREGDYARAKETSRGGILPRPGGIPRDFKSLPFVIKEKGDEDVQRYDYRGEIRLSGGRTAMAYWRKEEHPPPGIIENTIVGLGPGERASGVGRGLVKSNICCPDWGIGNEF